MIRTDLLPKPRVGDETALHLRAFFASCAFHGLVIGLLLWLTVLYGTKLPSSGSEAEAPSITLSTLVIVSPPQPVPVPPVQPVKPIKPLLLPPKVIPVPHPAVTTTVSKPTPAVTGSNTPPGLGDEFPHPAYPEELRNLRLTGTVTISVLFDTNGNVMKVMVDQSSGHLELDTFTRRFITSHWHAREHAGQLVTVPMEFRLENL